MLEIRLPLESGCTYHIYNRGNNKNKIFFKDENYRFFLKRYEKYMEGYVDTFAYCLLSNHFHLMVRVKSMTEITSKFCEEFVVIPLRALKRIELLDLGKMKDSPSQEVLPKLEEHQKSILFSWAVSEKMRCFLMSYAKAINKQEKRIGSLFQKPFRRKRIESESYFTRLIWYIHSNPVHHNLCRDLTSYQWSSYSSHTSDRPTILQRAEVLEWFGGEQKFVNFHKENALLFEDAKYWIE